VRFGFVGPAYQSQSPLADNEQLINWYPEQIESPNSRTQWALYPTPGLAVFAALGNFPTGVRGSYTTQGRTFKVAGTHLFELTPAGVTDYGGNPGTANNNMLDDGLPAVMVAGGTSSGTYPGQLLISSGGALTVFLLTTNAFAPLTTPPTNILMIDFLDGFFIALSAGNTWSVSNPEDATTWPGLAVAQVSVFSDQLLSVIASNRLLWVFGAKRAVAYYNSGAPLFPFDVVNGGFLEVGIQAQFSVARVAMKAGTTIMWLGGDERGGNIVFAANGFTPQRVSDHALEFWMSQQPTTSDAVGFATQEQGHNFYWLWFPSANATWRLDADLGFWHRMSSRVKGIASAHLARSHTFNFGLHLVGDRNSGNVYTMSSNFLNENTNPGQNTPIVRTRVGPTVSNESSQNPIPINEFQVDFELGLGPQPPLTDNVGNPRDPLAMFSYSEDFGKTFGPERMIPCGQAGNFLNATAIDRRLGSWRSFTPKVTVSDPIPWRVVDAYINGTQDSKERLTRSYARIS
jgi:hypothetical protein